MTLIYVVCFFYIRPYQNGKEKLVLFKPEARQFLFKYLDRQVSTVQKKLLPFLSKPISRFFITYLLTLVRQEATNLDNSLGVHEISNQTYRIVLFVNLM